MRRKVRAKAPSRKARGEHSLNRRFMVLLEPGKRRFDFDNREEAALFCIMNSIRHFFEVEYQVPPKFAEWRDMEIRKLWQLFDVNPITATYTLKETSWVDLAAKAKAERAAHRMSTR